MKRIIGSVFGVARDEREGRSRSTPATISTPLRVLRVSMMTASGPSLSATCASALRLSAAVMVVVSMILLQPSLFVTASDDGDHLNLTAVRTLVEGTHRHLRQLLAPKLKHAPDHKRLPTN